MATKTLEQIRADEVNELIKAIESKGGVVRFVSEIPDDADEQTDVSYIQKVISISVVNGNSVKEVIVVEVGIHDNENVYVSVKDIYDGKPVGSEQTYHYFDVLFSNLTRITDAILSDNAKKLENILEVTK